MQHALSNYTQKNNVNVSLNNNNNVNVSQSIKEADRIADWLEEKLCSPQSRPFYCKVAYSLNEPKIHQLLATAQERTKTTPARYFTFLANLEMNKNCG